MLLQLLLLVQIITPVFEDREYTMFSDVYGVAMVLSEVTLCPA
jgi:hypothetical protein